MGLYSKSYINSLFTDLQGQNGQITVLNSERLKGGNGTLKVIHGYATPTGDVGKLTVHLEGVPVNAPCELPHIPNVFGPSAYN